MRIFIKSNTYIYLAILLLALPVQWVSAWVVSIVFHEFFHWFAVKLCGGTVYRLDVELVGAEMRCSNLPERCRLFAILCGPIGGIALVCLGRWFPRIAICSFLLSVYNLLPVLPFDGGQAMEILLKSKKSFDIIQKIFLLVVILLALFATFYLNLGVLPSVVALGICLKHRKRPCKEDICRVQ